MTGCLAFSFCFLLLPSFNHILYCAWKCILFSLSCCTIFTHLLKWFNPSGFHPLYWWDPCHPLVHFPVIKLLTLGLLLLSMILFSESAAFCPSLFSSLFFFPFLVDSSHQYSPFPCCSIYKERRLHLILWQFHSLFSLQEFAFSIFFPYYTWQEMIAQHSHCLQIFAELKYVFNAWQITSDM